MCGIAGFIGRKTINKAFLTSALSALMHRGPDDEGVFTNSNEFHNLYFLHRRLSVIDLDKRASQPFRNKNYTLCFNGEIYNYIELKQELEKLGYSFMTESDTEVLSVALEAWGEKAIERLEGMWAFAWYDQEKKLLLLSRDRFGEKPLYLFRDNEGLYFSSEIKGILYLTRSIPNVNYQQMFRYLINGYKSLYKKNETFYENITELSPATNMWIDKNGSISQRTFWKPTINVREEWSYSDAVDAVQASLIEAVRLRMRTDVPLAFCQSGGIDSNCLISIASKVLNLNPHGFTIINSDKRYEEEEFIKCAVQNLGTKHTSINLSHDKFLAKLRKMVVGRDAPVSTISYFVHLQLLEAMRDNGYKVSVSGTGADELFTGYYDHHNFYLAEIFSEKQLFSDSLFNWQKYISPIVRNPFLKDPFLFIENENFREHIFLKSEEFKNWLKPPWNEEFKEEKYKSLILRNRMLNELCHETVPVLLHEDDHNSMSVSIENRSPFLDSKLFETAFSIPTRHLIRDGKTKSVLREAMKGIVPEKILDNRRKVGFNAPIADLLNLKDKNTREQILENSVIFEFVERSHVESLLQKEELLNSDSKMLFNILNSKFFLEQRETYYELL